MATIELLPRKEFKIVIDTQVIPGKFGTWALKRFCGKKGYSLQQLGEALSKNLSIDDMVEFILCAVEQSFRELKTKEAFPYNDVDACMWVDEMGGISGVDVSRLFAHASDEDAEKKNQELTG